MQEDTQIWHVARAGEQRGPYTFATLVAYAENGDLLSSDQVWRPGFSDWRSASEVPGLLAPPPPPLPAESSRGTAMPPPIPQEVPHSDRSNEGTGWTARLPTTPSSLGDDTGFDHFRNMRSDCGIRIGGRDIDGGRQG